MSSEDFKKKEKGKEIAFEEIPGSSLHQSDHFDHIEEVSMFLSEQKIAALRKANKETCRENTELDQLKNDNDGKVGNQEKRSSSSKITPCIFYTSDEKARLRWSGDLHDCFVNAVKKLGGPDKATPKSVKEIMEVEGIALHHVKSRLQKFRLGKCNIRNGTYQSNKRFKAIRSVTKTSATSSSPRPQVNIKPKFVKNMKPKKAKEVQGSLYMRIEHDLHLQRSLEAHRMQMALAIENQRNMLEAQYVEAGMAQSLKNQQNNYLSTPTSMAAQPTSQNLEHWLSPSSYHFIHREATQLNMNNPQQQNTTILETIPSHEDICNDNMDFLSLCGVFPHTSSTCLRYEPHHMNNSLIYSNQRQEQFSDIHDYNMAQGFINPYITIEPQSMHDTSTITTQQQLLSNGECVIQNSYHNATCFPSAILPTLDNIHQDISSNSIPLLTTPQSIQTDGPHHVYNSYPPYNTLEVVKAKLDALQNSNTSQIRETPYYETNLPSSHDDIDPVDMYIDWGKVEENEFETDFETDPVAILLALGFGVSP